MKQLLRFLSIGLILTMPLLAVRPVYAASATLSLSPASASISQGATQSISVRVNSGADSVNGIEAHLSYPADKLDYVSISSSSACPIVASSSGGGGSVRIERGCGSPPNGITGSQTVATVRFKAKVSTGTAAITFKPESKVISASSNQNILTGTSGGNYTLKAPAAAPAAAPADTIPPTITNVKATDIKINAATITWTTSEPATSEVNFGPNNGYGVAAVDGAMVTEHKVVLNSPILVPGTKFHFMVKSVDPGGNAASSNDNEFTTLGATLQIKVVNQKNKPVSGAKITFGDRTAVTGKNGEATMTGFAIGEHVGTIAKSGKETVVNTEVKTVDPSGKAQNVTFKIETGVNPLLILTLPLLALAALAVYLMRRRGGPGGGLGLSGILGKFTKRKRPAPAPTNTSQARTQPEPSIVKPSIIRPSGPSS